MLCHLSWIRCTAMAAQCSKSERQKWTIQLDENVLGDYKVKIKVKSPIVNRASQSSVTNASVAHQVLISVSKAPSRQCAADASPAIWDHTVLSLPATRYRRTRPCLIYKRRARPPHITAVTFPVKTVPTVNRNTCVWTTCPRSLPGVKTATCSARYRYTVTKTIKVCIKLTWLLQWEDPCHADHRPTTEASTSLAGTAPGERQAKDATVSAPESCWADQYEPDSDLHAPRWSEVRTSHWAVVLDTA